MSVKPMSPADIRREGIAALVERLGPGGALSFVRQCGVSVGDYTAGRAEMMRDATLDELVAEVHPIEQRAADSE